MKIKAKNGKTVKRTKPKNNYKKIDRENSLVNKNNQRIDKTLSKLCFLNPEEIINETSGCYHGKDHRI